MSKETSMSEGKVSVMNQMTFDQLRSILSDEIDKLRSGDTTAVTVNAISNASGKYLSSIKLQLEIYKMLGRRPDIQGLLPDDITEEKGSDDSDPSDQKNK